MKALTSKEMFAQARERVDIAKLSGVPCGRRGPCPLCEPRKERDTAFQHNRNGTFRCWRCDAWGDSVGLYAMLHGHLSSTVAAREILGLPLDGSRDGEAGAQPNAPETQRDPLETSRHASRSVEAQRAYRRRVIAELDNPGRWRVATASPGVQAWLQDARGLAVDLIPDALDRLRAAPTAYYAEDFETGTITRHPAMIAVIENIAGEQVGRHCTYLAPDGLNKAEVEAPRKVWGSSRGGVWLTEREPALGPLFIAEGIETVLAMLVRWREEHGRTSGRALAVLSLSNLQGGWLRDQDGRVELLHPLPDRDAPAVTWPDMGDVVIGVDHDMSSLRLKVRAAGGKTEFQSIDPTTRMQVCGSLASYWWRKAGATDVLVAYPPLGQDCNDVVLRNGDWQIVRHALRKIEGPS